MKGKIFFITPGTAQGNNFTLVYDGNNQAIATETTPGILNCDVTQPFWFSWVDFKIQLGRGHIIGEDVVLEMKSLNGPIRMYRVSLQTDRGFSAKWDLLTEPGKLYKPRYFSTILSNHMQDFGLNTGRCSI